MTSESDAVAEQSPLASLGWSDRWDALFAPYAEEGHLPARVIRADRGSVLVAGRRGVERAETSPRLRRDAARGADLPATGDWVALSTPTGHTVALVEAVLPRVSAFARSDPGKATAAQVLAANIDTVFVVHSLEIPVNLRRIERELAMTWESGAIPVVALNKADLAEDAEVARVAAGEVALGVEVVVTSAVGGEGLRTLASYAGYGRTVALIGPSGAGKSTLINALLHEDRQATRGVRLSDGRGRHTTSVRELIPLPEGGMLIDTPGMRALGVWDLAEGLEVAFADIVELAEDCRFHDCTHGTEPGCAVRAAVERGDLPLARLESWLKLLQEAEALERRHDVFKRQEHKRHMREISKSIKDYYKYKLGD